MKGFRQCDWRWPFLWESDRQPPARWHGPGEGPVHYFADTPDGAWAELIRREEITDPEDLATLRRNVWVVELGEPPEARPRLPESIATGPPRTWPECRKEARRLRSRGAPGFVAPSAALRPGEARGQRVDGGLRAGPARDGKIIVLFGSRPDLVAWPAAERARPPEHVLDRVRWDRSSDGDSERDQG